MTWAQLLALIVLGAALLSFLIPLPAWAPMVMFILVALALLLRDTVLVKRTVV